MDDEDHRTYGGDQESEEDADDFMR